MKTLTPEQIIALGPCEGYDLKQVTELFGNRESVTYLEILDTDKIPLVDIIWVFCQPDVLDDNVREQWLDIIVTRAVTNHALHCDVNDVEQWAKNWLSGVDRTAVAARNANAAANDAYNTATAAYFADAAADAAYAAGFAAIDYAIGTTTYAAYAAYVDNTYNAVRKTERKQQIQDLKNILQKG